MNKRMIAGIVAVFTLSLAACLLLAACFSPYVGDEAVITINLGGNANAKAVAWPPAESGVLGMLDYKITLSGTSKRLLTARGGNTISASVSPGFWSVDIEAFWDGELYATGTSSVDVKAGQNNPVTVRMNETDVTFFVVANDEDWYNAISLIGDGPGKRYVITVTASINAECRSTFGDGEGTHITIRGNHSITLDGTGFLLQINEKQTVIMRDLKLRGHGDNSASLVNVIGGTFIMEGSASVSGNTFNDASGGGGVYVDGGTFTMRDNSSVSGNKSIEGGGGDGYGGGVYVFNGGTFTMNSGEISGNISDNRGGGVYVNGGEFKMNGGSVSKNTASTFHGGGVYVEDSTFTMQGGSVSWNTADRIGGGVYVWSGTFTMSGGSVSKNTANVYYGGGVGVENGTFTMQGSASVSGNTADRSGGGVYVSEYGTFDMEGGASVYDNTVIDDGLGSGGGVFVDGGFTMQDSASVYKNTASSGGGVYVNNGTFTMSGSSKISGNTANGGSGSGGGGVYVYSGTFRISNGTVYGSDANPSTLRNTVSVSGGGAALYNSGTAEYGTFTTPGDPSTWSGTDLISNGPFDDTIRVVNGVR